MLVSSSAPLPPNTLTPIPQALVDFRNLQIGLLTARVNYARSITDCYAEQSGVAGSVGPYTAAELSASQVTSGAAASDVAGATIPSSSGVVTTNGAGTGGPVAVHVGGGRWAVSGPGGRGPRRLMPQGWTPQGAGMTANPTGSGVIGSIAQALGLTPSAPVVPQNSPTQSSPNGTAVNTYANVTSNPSSPVGTIVSPAPNVIPMNTVTVQSPGFSPAQTKQLRSSCGTSPNSQTQQPQMAMPKMFPNITKGSGVPRGMGDYSPIWGTSACGNGSNGSGSSSSSGINWMGMLLALSVSLGIIVVMEKA